MDSDNKDNKKEQQFLKSWKVAAKTLGPELFPVKSPTVDEAKDRNGIRPNPEAIEQHVNNNPGHHYFLFLVVSFFSYSMIETIFVEAGIGFPRIVDYQFLDETERMIDYSLIENCESW